MVRVGVDASIDEAVLADFTKAVQLVRVPEEPQEDIEVDFWVAAMPPRILRRQWPHLKGVKVIQAPWAGVDTLLKLFPPGVTLCDAWGVHAFQRRNGRWLQFWPWRNSCHSSSKCSARAGGPQDSRRNKLTPRRL